MSNQETRPQEMFHLFFRCLGMLTPNSGARDFAGEFMQSQRSPEALLAGHFPVARDLRIKRGDGVHAARLRPDEIQCIPFCIPRIEFTQAIAQQLTPWLWR